MSRMADASVVPHVKETLLELGKKRGPILVGPWLSEIGFEVLYWIPFLRWALKYGGIPAEDVYIVSRGGPRSWYADLSPNYLEILEHYTPHEFRAGNARRVEEQESHSVSIGLRHKRKSSKQHMITGFDKDIIAKVSKVAGLEKPRVLHPSLMYGLFRLFWRRQMPKLYDEMTQPKHIAMQSTAVGLPASYVAVKLYASPACTSAAPLNRRLVREMVHGIVQHSDVVLLHSGTKYDDHGEFPIDPHPRVRTVPLEPATNLETQSAVIAGANAFVCTYGGFAYLGPFLGTTTRTIYATPNFRRDHRDLMGSVAASILRTPLTVEAIGGGIAAKVAPRKRQHAA